GGLGACICRRWHASPALGHVQAPAVTPNSRTSGDTRRQRKASPRMSALRSPAGGGWPGRPYMLGQLCVVDDPEPEPVDGDVAAGSGEAAVLAASAGAARASATPPAAPIMGTARSQSFLGSRIDVTSFVELARLQRLRT